MIWFLISLIGGIIYFRYEEPFPDGSDNFYGAITGLLIGAVPAILVGCIFWCFLPKKIIMEETKIIALTDNTSIRGQKYLFSGYIDEKYIYRYVIETNDGKQIKELQNSKDVYIKYDNEDPRIVEAVTNLKHEWMWLFAIGVPDIKYTIYVPEGTITEKYDIDLES